MEREIHVAGQPQAFTAPAVAILVLLSSDQAPQPMLAACIDEPLGHVSQVEFLGLISALSADQLPIVEDHPFDAVPDHSAADHLAHFIQAGPRQSLVKRRIAGATSILSDLPSQILGWALQERDGI